MFKSSLKSMGLLIGLVSCGFTAVLAQEGETYEVAAPDLKLAIPKSWKQEPPSNNLRFAQFAIPAAEGDTAGAEMVVSVAIGGSTKANVDRWISQFSAEGRQSKVTAGNSPQGKYIFVDVSGTYNQPVGPPIQGRTKPTPGYRMLGVIITGKRGNNFLKLTGPTKTIEAHAAGFRKSFGGNAEGETSATLSD